MKLADEIKLIEKETVDLLISALDKEEITEEELPFICDYILTKTDEIEDHAEVMPFLRELADRWRIFTPLLVKQSGEIKEKAEGEVAAGVLTLAQVGKIEQAIKLAKTMTEKSVQQGGVQQ